MSEPDLSERRIGGADGNVVLDLFVLHQRIGDLMAAALAGTGVRPAEYAVYSQLDGDPVTARALTARLGVTPSTLTGHLAAIERRGHLARSANPADGRSALLSLTPAGGAVREECRHRFAAMLRAFESALGPATDDVRALLLHLDETAAAVAAELK